MAALLAGTSLCALCVTDSVCVYVYVCVCLCVCNSAGFAWGYQRPFCVWMCLLQGSPLTKRHTQQGVILILYSRHWWRKKEEKTEEEWWKNVTVFK